MHQVSYSECLVTGAMGKKVELGEWNEAGNLVGPVAVGWDIILNGVVKVSLLENVTAEQM